MIKTWGIIGLGWLGAQLASELKKINVNTWGTHTADFNFQTDEFPRRFCDVLFLNTPPLIQMPAELYVEKIPKLDGTRIIFISSTSVYGATAGLIMESTPTAPVTQNGRWLVDVENELARKFNTDPIIIRPGGLIGGQRHPIFSLAKKGEITDGDQVVNLIHRSDLIGISLAAITAGTSGIINAVTPYHPQKKEYYSQWADRLGLPPLSCPPGSHARRQIDSTVLRTLYPDWHCPKLDCL